MKNPQVGRNVRHLRKVKKISIRRFCERVVPSIAPVQLIAVEKERREPTLVMVQRFAKALDVSVDDLLKPAEPEGMAAQSESPSRSRKQKKVAGVRR